MSYREENSQVVLTMPREDYERLLFRLGAFLRLHGGGLIGRILDEELKFLNRLNEGNPNYTPYEVKS